MSSPLSAFASLGQPASNSEISVQINGVDLSTLIDVSLIDINYRESFSDRVDADFLEISISDPEGKLRTQFPLVPGMPVTASITINNWSTPASGSLTKQLSGFYVKSVKMEADKGSGTRLNIRCSTIDPTNSFRLTRKSAGYPAPGAAPTSLKALAQLVANENGWSLNFNATDFNITRVDQHDFSDATLLHRICGEKYYTYKVVGNTLFISDMASVESQPAIGTFVCPSTTEVGGFNGSGLVRWELRAESEDCMYAVSRSAMFDQTTGQTVIGTSTDPNVQKGPTLINHQHPHSPETFQQDGIEQENSGD
jgi:hypothetical protein